MRIQIVTAIMLSLAFSQQQRGLVSTLTAAADVSVGIMQFTVRGTNPCGAVFLDYGDGIAITYPIRDLPVSITHEYTKVGNFRVIAKGMGNCDGVITIGVKVATVRPQPPPPQPPPPPPPARKTPSPPPPPATPPPPAIRFAEMDRNGDGVITRAEWRGKAQAFDQEDWNGDGRLSGEEVRIGAQPPRGGGNSQAAGFGDWTEARFRLLDRNGDNMLSLNEFLRGDPGALTMPGQEPGARGGGRDAPEAILVSARAAWTDTGIDVRAGDVLTIRATGTIQYTGDTGALAGPDGARGRAATGDAPLPREVIGALIARVGNAAPFFVGATPDAFRAPRNGRLYLGVNDDVLSDNRGEFRVTVTVSRGVQRP